MPAENFEEEVFLWALTTRPEDAKKFATVFKPDWLMNAEYIPVLAEIYAFTRKNGVPPSIVTLKKIFRSKDEQAYELRFESALDDLQKRDPDLSDVIFTLDQARGVAVVRSFIEMVGDRGFQRKQESFDGTAVLKDIQGWLHKFSDIGTDATMDLKQAITHLIQNTGFIPPTVRIPCGISPLDMWSGGGLRTRQLGIIMAPTGHGKSAALAIMAHKMAAVQRKNVWLITNELPIEEVAERLLCRLTGTEMDLIMEDPILGYHSLDRHWNAGLEKRLIITDYNREVTMDQIESDMARLGNLYGWKPDVIVLDFMERMKPSLTGYRRDKEWQWLEAISKDMARFNKRNNTLIWTACQTNREGLSSNDLHLGMGQASIRHFQESSMVIAMSQVEIPGTEKIAMKFKALKCRQSRRPTRPVVLECNLAKMSITNSQIDFEELLQEETPTTPIKGGSLTPRQMQVGKRKGK